MGLFPDYFTKGGTKIHELMKSNTYKFTNTTQLINEEFNKK